MIREPPREGMCHTKTVDGCASQVTSGKVRVVLVVVAFAVAYSVRSRSPFRMSRCSFRLNGAQQPPGKRGGGGSLGVSEMRVSSIISLLQRRQEQP